MSTRLDGMIEVPALRRAFYGVTHQFASGESTGALTAGQVGASDAVKIDSTYDFVALARAAVYSLATGGQAKVLLYRDREPTLAEAVARQVGGMAVTGDVTNRVDVRRIFAEAAKWAGGRLAGVVDIVGIADVLYRCRIHGRISND